MLFSTVSNAATNAGADSMFKLGGDLSVNRLGFGAMRITGEGIWGWPKDREEARKVLKRAAKNHGASVYQLAIAAAGSIPCESIANNTRPLKAVEFRANGGAHEKFQGIRITPKAYTTLGEVARFCEQMGDDRAQGTAIIETSAKALRLLYATSAVSVYRKQVPTLQIRLIVRPPDVGARKPGLLARLPDFRATRRCDCATPRPLCNALENGDGEMPLRDSEMRMHDSENPL